MVIEQMTKDTKKHNNLFTYSLVRLCSFVFCLTMCLPVFAFEDVLITNDSKLTEIRIENHDIIDVFPLITVMNDKNTVIVHPIKEGQSKFSVLKNDKTQVVFSVKVEAERTTISSVEGFDILPIDVPPEVYEFELDEPPIK